jgi:hypothetical protein
LRLVTRLPERPLRNLPRLRSRIARATFLDAFLLYFLAIGAPSTLQRRNKSTNRANGAVNRG